MSGKRHPEEFKIEVIKQMIERGRAATELAAGFGSVTIVRERLVTSGDDC